MRMSYEKLEQKKKNKTQISRKKEEKLIKFIEIIINTIRVIIYIRSKIKIFKVCAIILSLGLSFRVSFSVV